MVACDNTRKAVLPQPETGHSPNDPSAAPLPRSGYRFLAAIIESVQVHGGPLAEKLDAAHLEGGRKGYGAMPKLCAVVLQSVLNVRYANRFLSELDANLESLAICGLENAPTEGPYSRFKKALTQYVDEVDLIMAKVVKDIGDELERLREAGIVPADAPQLGDYVSFDSTDIEAYGNPKRKTPRDPNAAWGYRTSKHKSGSKKAGEKFYGYKDHEAADSYYGVPLAGITLPANAGDGPQLPKLVDEVQRLHPQLRFGYGLGDKAYAGQARLQYLVDHGITPVVAVPMPRKNKHGRRLFDGIFTEEGRLTCLGGEPMEYLGYDPERGHLFRCPGLSCAEKHEAVRPCYCDYEAWVKPEGRLLRTVGILPRFTEEFERIMRMRSGIERYFRSGKHSRLLNQHQFLGIAKVDLHVKVSRLAYVATVLARLKANDYAGMRHMTVRLPRRRRKPVLPPEDACNGADCACCNAWAKAA